MSAENALQYLKMLDEDKILVKAINNILDNKVEHMVLINERGLEFTKNEFKQALNECMIENLTLRIKGGANKRFLTQILILSMQRDYLGKAWVHFWELPLLLSLEYLLPLQKQ